jgi:hypothetical protein
MPILKNCKHELFAYPGYNCARWRRRHGKPGWLGFERSFRSGRGAVRVDDKFSANFASKMDEGELNTIASELKLLRLVIETATATSVSSSAPLGMSTVHHPLLLEARSLFQANAMGEMLPAAGPVKVRDDRPQKPKSADMMGHNDGPALDGTNPFSTPPAPQAPAQATPGIPTPLRPASALPAAVPRVLPLPPGCGLCDRRLPGVPRRWARPPLLALCPVLGRAPPMPAKPVIPEEQARDAIEDRA